MYQSADGLCHVTAELSTVQYSLLKTHTLCLQY